MAVIKTISRDDVRTSILEASIALMNEGGLGSLSMREVARRAGVSHQAPYHYFTDREAILAELAELAELAVFAPLGNHKEHTT